MSVFRVRNLRLRYPAAKHDALVIAELDIAQGDIVFVVGPSGLGKSTLLESLGLMTNTIASPNEPSAEFSLFENRNLLDIWKQGDASVSKIRKDLFSFVFQNTNLFSNLSALENVMITSVLQGESLVGAEERAREILKKIYPDLKTDAHVSALSGGQRQRLAFARAIACDHEIFFADEPTGNLDHGNAQILMNLLVGQLQAEKKTAVIVSHSIDLAMQFASKIVWLSAVYLDKDTKHGLVSADRTFLRVPNKAIHWVNVNGKEISQVELTQDILSDLVTIAKQEVQPIENQ